MEQKLKIVILVLVALLGFSLSIVFSIQNSKLALLREYNDNKQKLIQENKELGRKLNAILAENKGLKERLEAIQADLARITSEKEQAQQGYKLASKEKTELAEKIKSYPHLEKDMQEKISSLQESKASLEAEIKKLRQDNQSLKQQLRQAKYASQENGVSVALESRQEQGTDTATRLHSVDLPPIVVSSQPSPSSGVNLPLIEGKVLEVNSEYNFVVINLGRETGISEGMVFQVFRNDEFLGKVEVIQLREEISACDIIEMAVPFKKGDIVRY